MKRENLTPKDENVNSQEVKTKSKTLLQHIERVIELAKDSKLNDEFYKKAKRSLRFIEKMMNLTTNQAVMFAIFIEQCDDECIRIKDLSRFLDCKNIKTICLMNDIDELEKRRLVRCCRSVSAVCANASYFVIIFNALAYFFPSLFERDHLTLVAFTGGTAIIWFIQFLVCKGVRKAALLNVVVQIAKIMPILLFLTILIAVFNIDKFSFDFFGSGKGLSNLGTQVKSIMLVTVWVFIGIEGAIVLSERAKQRKDIGRATLIALACALLIYMLISLLTFGYMSRQEVAALDTPSTAYILEQIVGTWGAAGINIGLVISILGAMLGWTILASEVIYVGAKDKLLPKIFTKENRHGTPVNSLLLTNVFSQILLIITFLSAAAYEVIFFIATTAILIPYLLSGMYGMKLRITGETYDKKPDGRRMDIFIATISTMYAIWLVYAAGIVNLLVVSILYAPGILLYAKVRKENSKKIFNNRLEVVVFSVISMMAVIAVLMLIRGIISLTSL